MRLFQLFTRVVFEERLQVIPVALFCFFLALVCNYSQLLLRLLMLVIFGVCCSFLLIVVDCWKICCFFVQMVVVRFWSDGFDCC